MTAYFISGLGADERIFQRIKLPERFTIKHVRWIEPLRNESLVDYCLLLAQQIDASKDFILVGLSFGGIVAVELNKLLPAKLVVLISSIATNEELPLRYLPVRMLKLHKTVPMRFLKWHTKTADWFFGIESEEERNLVSIFMAAVSPNYLRWALDRILSWKNHERPANLFHIHGTKDRILPFQRTRADVSVKNGGHFMIYNKAAEINRLLSEKLVHYFPY